MTEGTVQQDHRRPPTALPGGKADRLLRVHATTRICVQHASAPVYQFHTVLLVNTTEAGSAYTCCTFRKYNGRGSDPTTEQFRIRLLRHLIAMVARTKEF